MLLSLWGMRKKVMNILTKYRWVMGRNYGQHENAESLLREFQEKVKKSIAKSNS